MKRVLSVIGTRPEVIKMAPVIKALETEPTLESRILSTAQHREMLDQMLQTFNIIPDLDLNIMKENQTLPELTARMLLPLTEVLVRENPDFVLGQGDTSTVLMVALACFYQKIPFGHVEAGLRTGDLYNPYPEEMNRVLVSRLATLNFAPTVSAKQNLLLEGYQEKGISITGNTIIDALEMIDFETISLDERIDPEKRLLLVTAHRRENLGENLLDICRGLKTIVEQNQDVQIYYPVHPNPQVSEIVYRELGKVPQVMLSAPLSYLDFIGIMKRAYFILSDSGGVQEESPALGKPVLVLRETTERPEAVHAGASKLIGTKCEKIVREAQILLSDPKVYQKMVVNRSLFGDGHAAKKIVNRVKKFLMER